VVRIEIILHEDGRERDVTSRGASGMIVYGFMSGMGESFDGVHPKMPQEICCGSIAFYCRRIARVKDDPDL
jgi:hypothetical protein